MVSQVTFLTFFNKHLHIYFHSTIICCLGTNVQIMQTKTHLELHNDHLLWRSDLNMWLNDVKIWENEISDLVDNLRIIEMAIDRHINTYQKHQRAIHEHELDINKHELDLRLLAEGSEYDQRLNNEHQFQSQQHLLHKDTHQKLKQYHYTLAGLISHLRRSLQKNSSE